MDRITPEKWYCRTKVPPQGKYVLFYYMKKSVIRSEVLCEERNIEWMAAATCVPSALLSASLKNTTCSISHAHHSVFTCFAAKKNNNKLSFMDQILDYIEGTFIFSLIWLRGSSLILASSLNCLFNNHMVVVSRGC